MPEPIVVGEFLEVARVGDTVQVRDLRDPEDPFVYTLPEWRAFCAGAKAGEFDHLIGRAGPGS